MAIVFTSLDSNKSGNPTSGWTTASVTIPLNDLGLFIYTAVDVQSAPALGTPSGSGITNVIQVATVTFPVDRRTTVFSFKGTGTAATISNTTTPSMEGSAYAVGKVAGVATTLGALGNGVQQATTLSSNITSGTAINTTALATLQSNSATFLAIGGNEGFTASVDPPSGWTELSDQLSPLPYILEQATYYKVAGETNPTAAINGLAGTPSYGTILLEILDVGGVSSNAWMQSTSHFRAV
jgi:hypothetical protein